MKRDIRCNACANAADHADCRVYGWAKNDYRCDLCGSFIPENTPCCAVTFLIRPEERMQLIPEWWVDFLADGDALGG